MSIFTYSSVRQNIEGFLGPQDKLKLPCVSQDFYIYFFLNKRLHQDPSSCVFYKEIQTDIRPRPFKRMVLKGFSNVSECACRPKLLRPKVKTDDWRGIFEETAARIIQTQFSQKNKLQICFIASGGGFDALALFLKIQQKMPVHSILLVDPVYYPSPSANKTILQLKKIIKAISPPTTVKTNESIQDLIVSGSVQKTDAFVLFDANVFRKDHHSPEEEIYLYKNFYAQLTALRVAMQSGKSSNLYIWGDRIDHDRHLLTRVFSHEQDGDRETAYLNFDLQKPFDALWLAVFEGDLSAVKTISQQSQISQSELGVIVKEAVSLRVSALLRKFNTTEIVEELLKKGTLSKEDWQSVVSLLNQKWDADGIVKMWMYDPESTSAQAECLKIYVEDLNKKRQEFLSNYEKQ